MEKVGFVFEKIQKPYNQKREVEYKFIHPTLMETLFREGLNTRAKKFYIKPISDSMNAEIGLVTGKTTPLISKFIVPNARDTYDNSPAWVNRGADNSLNKLLYEIGSYLGSVK